MREKRVNPDVLRVEMLLHEAGVKDLDAGIVEKAVEVIVEAFRNVILGDRGMVCINGIGQIKRTDWAVKEWDDHGRAVVEPVVEFKLAPGIDLRCIRASCDSDLRDMGGVWLKEDQPEDQPGDAYSKWLKEEQEYIEMEQRAMEEEEDW